MEKKLRNIFYYLKKSITIEKPFDNIKKVRWNIISILFISIFIQLFLSYSSKVITNNQSYQQINLILNNVLASLNEFDLSNVLDVSLKLEQHFMAFFTSEWPILLSRLLVSIFGWIFIMILVVKYMFNFVLSNRKLGYANAKLMTYYSEEYEESNEQLSQKFNKNIFKFGLCFYVFDFLFDLFVLDFSLINVIIEVWITRIMYFTIFTFICCKISFAKSLRTGIKIFGESFWKITFVTVIFSLICKYITIFVYSLGSKFNIVEVTPVLLGFLNALLAFIKARFYFYVFADATFGNPKKEN